MNEFEKPQRFTSFTTADAVSRNGRGHQPGNPTVQNVRTGEPLFVDGMWQVEYTPNPAFREISGTFGRAALAEAVNTTPVPVHRSELGAVLTA